MYRIQACVYRDTRCTRDTRYTEGDKSFSAKNHTPFREVYKVYKVYQGYKSIVKGSGIWCTEYRPLYTGIPGVQGIQGIQMETRAFLQEIMNLSGRCTRSA